MSHLSQLRPTLEEASDNNSNAMQTQEKKSRDKARNRSACFCVGFSKFWKKPIHTKPKALRNKHDPKWLRISMSHHPFPNLREAFQGDLSAKLTDGVKSLDFEDRDCNCR